MDIQDASQFIGIFFFFANWILNFIAEMETVELWFGPAVLVGKLFWVDFVKKFTK